MKTTNLTGYIKKIAIENNPFRLFWTALDNVYDDVSLQSYIFKKGNDPSNQKLSAGTSVKRAPDVLLKALIRSVGDHEYRFYTPSSGSARARQALALKETICAGLAHELTREDVIMSVGSTGAISALFELTKRMYSKGTVLIAAPTYYLYRFCARYNDLPYREVYSMTKISKDVSSFLCPDEIVNSMNEQTKLVCIVNPTNPTGETYSAYDLKRILVRAKKMGSIVLVDELFSGLSYGPKSPRALKVAEETNTKDNLVIVSGFSKELNLAGFRIGYTVCQNKEVAKQLRLINQARYCFPMGYQVDNMIVLESILSLVRYGVQPRAAETCSQNLGLSNSENDLSTIYAEYQKDVGKTIREYRAQLEYALTFLKDVISCKVNSEFGFNSFVRIRAPKNINPFDFAVNCYLGTGIKIELGPCFGMKITHELTLGVSLLFKQRCCLPSV